MKFFNSKTRFALFALPALFAVACAPARTERGNDPGSANFLVGSVSNVKMETLEVDPVTQLPSVRAYTLKACLQDAGGMRTIYNQPFAITGGSTTEVKTTDSEGCVYWQERINFNNRARDTYISLDRSIEARGAFSGSQKIPLALNPWRSGGDSLVDLRTQQVANLSRPDQALTAAVTPNGPRLHLDSLSLFFNGNRFTVDKFMRLTQYRKYIFNLTPLIRYPNRTDQGINFNTIPAGRFKMKALLMTRPYDDQVEFKPQMISYYEAEVNVEDGNLTHEGELAFDFDEIPYVAARNKLVVKLESLNPADAIAPTTVSIPFDGSASWNFKPTFVDEDLDLIYNRFLSEAARTNSYELVHDGNVYKLRQKLTVDPIESFRKFYRIQPFGGLKVSQAQALSDAQLEQLAAADAEKVPASLQGGLCGYLSFNASELKACKKRTNQYMRFAKSKHVEKITGTPLIVDSRKEDIGVSASFHVGVDHVVSDSRTRTAQVGVNGNLGVSLPTKLPISVGAGVSTGYGISWSHTMSDSVSSGKSLSQTTSVSLNLKELTFSIPMETRSCLVVYNLKHSDQWPLHICSKAPAKAEKVTEAWYYISDFSSSDGAILPDMTDVRERPWTRVFRGKMNYFFLKADLDSKRSLMLDRVADPKTIKKGLQPIDQAETLGDLFENLGAFPGTVPAQ